MFMAKNVHALFYGKYTSEPLPLKNTVIKDPVFGQSLVKFTYSSK